MDTVLPLSHAFLFTGDITMMTIILCESRFLALDWYLAYFKYKNGKYANTSYVMRTENTIPMTWAQEKCNRPPDLLETESSNQTTFN